MAAMPPWAMVAGGLLGLDKLVFEPAGNIYKSVQGIRNDANASDAVANIQRYQKSADLAGYDPTGEGYMDYETGAKIGEARRKRLDDLYKSEAEPVSDAVERMKSDPTIDLTQDPRVYLASKGIQVDTTNPYTMEALNAIGKHINLIRNNKALVDDSRAGKRSDSQLLATTAGEKPENLKKYIEAYQASDEPVAQQEFWKRQAETEGKNLDVPAYASQTAGNIAATPGLNIKPTDVTSMRNSQRELLEKTPNGPLQQYTLGVGGATETGVRQGFRLGPQKEIGSVQYTTPAKVMYPGSYAPKGGGEKRNNVVNSNILKAVNKMNDIFTKEGDSEKYQRSRRTVQNMINAAEKSGVDIDYTATGLEFQNNKPQKQSATSKKATPQKATPEEAIAELKKRGKL